METKLYGLVEGLYGTHKVNMPTYEVMARLPEDIKRKCVIDGNRIKAFSPCDG